MSKLSKLLQVTASEKQQILDSYNITEQQFEDDVQVLKSWALKNAHLPSEFITENKLRVCLLNSKMSLERAKQCLEGYFKVRAVYADFFDKLIPNTKEFERVKDYVTSIVMPKLGPDLSRITVFKLHDINGESEDALLYYITTLMIAELRVSNDLFLSNVLVVDMVDYNFKTFLKYTPTVNQKLVNILMAVNLRIKEIHVLNAPPFVDRMLGILKSILPAKIMSKIHLHNSLENLHAFIPKQYLPSNYGGTEPSTEELYDEWCEEMRNSDRFFKDLLNAKSKEELKVERDEQAIFGMGADGSFKKLAID